MKNPNVCIPHCRTGALLACLIMSGLLSTGTLAQSEEVVFSSSGDSPWQLYLGSNANWMVPVQGPETTSHKSKVVTVRRIDNEAIADAVQAEWKGGLGQVYWQQADPQDYSELAAQGGALSMVIRIDKKPKKSVDIKMDCGYPCAGTLNMTKLFKAVPKDTWLRVSLKLSCFEAAGANLGNILAPMVVATSGSFKLSISDVRLLADPPPGSLVECG